MKNYIGIGCFKPESEFVRIIKKAMREMAGQLFSIDKGLLVLVSGEELINQEQAQALLFTDVFSQIFRQVVYIHLVLPLLIS